MKLVQCLAVLVFLVVSSECLADAKSCREDAEVVEAIAQFRDDGAPSWDALAVMLQAGVSPQFAGRVIEWVYNDAPDAMPIEFKEAILKGCRVLERREKARKH